MHAANISSSYRRTTELSSYFAQEQSRQSMECAANPWFVAQSIDHYFAQDNPWIAQTHSLRITWILDHTSQVPANHQHRATVIVAVKKRETFLPVRSPVSVHMIVNIQRNNQNIVL